MKSYDNMRLCVLISCMHQADRSIVERSNVQCDCVVVNQCDRDEVVDYDYTNCFGQTRHVRFISTTERGLSRSRNMAIENAPDDAICMVCDDDEWIEPEAEERILNAYRSMPECSVATFSLIRKDCGRTYPTQPFRVGFKKALSVNSLQITFRKAAIDAAGIRFDVKMGSGTGNGGGEENKFILDCLRAKLRVQYFPVTIATVLPGDSQWYQGHDAKFLCNNGWAARRLLGTPLGFAYICYSTYHLRARYKKAGLTPWVAFKSLLSGFLSKR